MGDTEETLGEIELTEGEALLTELHPEIFPEESNLTTKTSSPPAP